LIDGDLQSFVSGEFNIEVDESALNELKAYPKDELSKRYQTFEKKKRKRGLRKNK
jgi:hypothetical protein